MFARIRAEAIERSQIIQTLHMLTDVYGPRLTGSPNLKAASDWVVKRTTEWGLKNAHLEPWEFGRPGWLNERTSAFLISPVKDSLVVETLAWTPGTKGAVDRVGRSDRAAVARDPGTARPRTSTAIARKVKGRSSSSARRRTVPVTINPPAKRRRRRDRRVRSSIRRAPPQGGPRRTATRPAGPAPRGPRRCCRTTPVTEQFDQFLVTAGAVARVNDAGRDHGQIRAFSNSHLRRRPRSCRRW